MQSIFYIYTEHEQVVYQMKKIRLMPQRKWKMWRNLKIDLQKMKKPIIPIHQSLQSSTYPFSSNLLIILSDWMQTERQKHLQINKYILDVEINNPFLWICQFGSSQQNIYTIENFPRLPQFIYHNIFTNNSLVELFMYLN